MTSSLALETGHSLAGTLFALTGAVASSSAAKGLRCWVRAARRMTVVILAQPLLKTFPAW
jgi:hypothetical protein